GVGGGGPGARAPRRGEARRPPLVLARRGGIPGALPGGGVPGSHAPQPPRTSRRRASCLMTRLAVGVIGAGKHGERYLRHASRDVPEIAVAALARRNADLGRAQAAALDCRYHTDWRALVDDPRVEAVIVVVTP